MKLLLRLLRKGETAQISDPAQAIFSLPPYLGHPEQRQLVVTNLEIGGGLMVDVPDPEDR